MPTPASIKRHPIHPMLVVFPIGLWVFSLVSDFIFVTGVGGPVWSTIAAYTMAGGLIGALLAAIPGLVDLLSIHDPQAKRVGVTHMTLNLVVVALYAVNLWLRLGTDTGTALPMVLSIVAVMMLGISGWLGGELVYRHGVAVDMHRPFTSVQADGTRTGYADAARRLPADTIPAASEPFHQSETPGTRRV